MENYRSYILGISIVLFSLMASRLSPSCFLDQIRNFACVISIDLMRSWPRASKTDCRRRDGRHHPSSMLAAMWLADCRFVCIHRHIYMKFEHQVHAYMIRPLIFQLSSLLLHVDQQDMSTAGSNALRRRDMHKVNRCSPVTCGWLYAWWRRQLVVYLNMRHHSPPSTMTTSQIMRRCRLPSPMTTSQTMQRCRSLSTMTTSAYLTHAQEHDTPRSNKGSCSMRDIRLYFTEIYR